MDFITSAHVAQPYDSGLGRAVVLAKGTGDRATALRLARGLGRRVADDPDLVRSLRTATAVSWIPSPWTRRAARGFSLPALLAQRVGLALDKPVIRSLSLAHGARQARATARQRKVNLVGRLLAARELAPGTYVLVDDVITTGTSASVAARELLGSGATKVVVVALCRADNASNDVTSLAVRIL